MPFSDLRECIAALRERDDVRDVRGASWDCEMGTIAELTYERGGPALLFDDITGHQPGFRVLTNALDTRQRSLLALGLPTDLDLESALKAYQARVRAYQPVPR